MTTAKTLTVAAAAIAVVALLVSFGIILSLTAPAARASGAAQALGCTDSTNFIATTTPGYGADCNGNATSTPTYVISAATTTALTLYTGNAVAMDLNLYEKAASSSSAVVNFTVWVSNNDVDWYPLSGTTGIATVNTWTPATALSSTTSFHFSGLNEKYAQVREFASGANSAIYTQAILANQIVN